MYKLFPQKLNIMKHSFSLTCEILCIKPVFGACLYAVSHSRADTEKLQLELNGPFSVCAHMNVMIQNGKLHMNKHQKQI